ncbi:MAG: right-handed parallel beta-helix repeat-containing protein [Planctomycetota bacterium]
MEGLIDTVRAHHGDAVGLDDIDEAHPLVEALRGKQLRKHRVVVAGAHAFYFASDDETVVLVTAGPSVVRRYVMPSVRGADFVLLDGQPAAAGEVLPAAVAYTVTDLGWFWLEPRITLTLAAGQAPPITGAVIDESNVQHHLRVDPAASGPETFATVTEAVARASELLQRGEGVKITVAPGTYREGQIEMWCGSWPQAAREAVLIIEGEGDAPPLITGADDWSGDWQPVPEAEGVYRKDWPHRFGLSRQTWERWGYLIDPRVARSEVVTVDGQILLPSMLERFAWVDPDGAVPLEETAESENQPGRWKPLGVREPSSLLPGAFGIVEAEGVIYVRPDDGVNLNAAAVEVSVRPFLLYIQDRKNVVLRNLAFKHAATFVDSRARAVRIKGHQVLVEDCRFDEHGSKGLGIDGEKPTGITLRRCTFNGNGWQGLSVGYRLDNYILEDCESSYNNWRGHTGLQYGWDAAGCKAFAVDGQIGLAIRGHRAFANLTSGFWLDQSFTPRSPVEVSDSYFIANQFGAQLYLEKLTGPITVQRNVIWNDVGLRGIDGTSWDVQLRDNVLYTASEGHPAIYLHKRGIESEYANYSKHWTMENNLLVSSSAASPILTDDCTPEQYVEFLETLKADGNVYFAPVVDAAFPLPAQGWSGFSAWQSATGQDATSVWVDPQFASAEDFRWDIQNSDVAGRLPNLPKPLSGEDRAKLQHALAQSQRFLSITAAAGHSSGPAFELGKNAIANHWSTIDLSSVANRPLVGDDAWIGAGNALPHLEVGRHVFAGVPFDIPDSSQGEAIGVALHSEKVQSTFGQTLPKTVELPIGQGASAVYVLHGAGWIDTETEPAAVYELVYADGTTHAVEIRPQNTGVEDARIGEWYHAFPVFDTPDTRHVSLMSHGQSPGATLYVTEIVNPSPDRTVTALRLRSFQGRNTSVIVLGVTRLDT